MKMMVSLFQHIRCFLLTANVTICITKKVNFSLSSLLV